MKLLRWLAWRGYLVWSWCTHWRLVKVLGVGCIEIPADHPARADYVRVCKELEALRARWLKQRRYLRQANKGVYMKHLVIQLHLAHLHELRHKYDALHKEYHVLLHKYETMTRPHDDGC